MFKQYNLILRANFSQQCQMSLSVSLHGVYGVYWGGVFTGPSGGPQPRQTVGCRRLSPSMGAGCMGCIGVGCLRGSQAHSPDRLLDVAVCHPVWGRGVWGVLERGVYGALRPTAQTDYRMSLSTTLYGGGVNGVY